VVLVWFGLSFAHVAAVQYRIGSSKRAGVAFALLAVALTVSILPLINDARYMALTCPVFALALLVLDAAFCSRAVLLRLMTYVFRSPRFRN